ncbi:MAG: glycosyltransferase, partial [Longimicrobiales bacterium]
ALGRLARRTLDGLEWLRLRRLWRRLNGTTRRYWYWRGVADELRGPAQLSHFLTDSGLGRGRAAVQSEADIDLAAGLEEAERRLDAERPAAARFRFGDAVIGRVEPAPGVEPLRGAHLRPLLDTRFGTSLLNAAAVEAVVTTGSSAGADVPWPIETSGAARLDAPHLVAELNLAERTPDLNVPPGYGAARVLLRAPGRLLGWVCISSFGRPVISAVELRTAAAEQIGPALWPYLLSSPWRCRATGDPLKRGRPPGTRNSELATRQPSLDWPPVTVVVCTRDRTERLARCLKALRELDYPAYDVIVVDNAPSDQRTARLAAESGVRYVREDVQGLDRARNQGIRAARHDIIAFTDDDVCVDREWLRQVAAAFDDPDVMAVTGFVAPRTLDTRAERLFEIEYGGMSHGTRPRTFRRSELRNAQLLWASAIGCGANMAFRKRVFDAVGGFDVGLDVGTLAGGAGDVEILHRIVVSGHTAAYRPAALVWHAHRPTLPQLRRQLFDNGRSFGAYLITCFRRGTVPRHAIVRFAVQDWFSRWILRRLVRPGRFPRGLVVAEMVGALLSPLFYLGAHWENRRRPERQTSAQPDAAAAHASPGESEDALEPVATVDA